MTVSPSVYVVQQYIMSCVIYYAWSLENRLGRMKWFSLDFERCHNQPKVKFDLILVKRLIQSV